MKKLTIVQMNDSHAYLEMHPELFWEKAQAVYRPAGGYARIAAKLKQIRKENPGQVLFLDGGDTFHGTYPALETKGRGLVPILNALAPAAMTAHWEFAYTPNGFKALTEKLSYPMLAINVYDKPSDELFFKPYEVVEMAGLRVGIIGIASNIVDKSMPPKFSEGVYFTNGSKELPGFIRTVREEEKADLVILISHLGFPQDMHLMQEVPGVDVVLSAHTHHRLSQAVRQGTALVVQSGSHGSFLTQLDLTIEDRKVTDFQHQLIKIEEDIQPDGEVTDLVRQVVDPYREELGEVVGQTRTALDRGYNLETTMDNFLLSSILDYSGAEMAFSNGWRYGAPVLPGRITLNDLYNMVPMNPPISTVDLTGRELLSMLEKNLEHTFSRDPFNQMGGYVKRSAGLRAMIKIENPPLHRIQKLFVGEQEVHPKQVYQAAFITEQGVSPGLGQNRQQHEERIIAAMRAYLKKHDPLTVGKWGTFTVI